MSPLQTYLDERLFHIDRPEMLADYLAGYRRFLLFGEIGAGKSTLAIKLVQLLTEQEGDCHFLELDPGSPPFGIPGSVGLASWQGQDFILHRYQALCSFDANRFRLPLLLAARRLIKKTMESGGERSHRILIDPPGVVRGVGGAELLMALAESLKIDVVVTLRREENDPMPLAQELAALQVKAIHLRCSPAAKASARLEQLKRRTTLWDRFLADGTREVLAIDRMHLLGTPPPREIPEAWIGRQVALLDAGGETLRMGEIIELHEGELSMRTGSGRMAEPVSILLRDAGRSVMGRMQTVKRPEPSSPGRRQPVEMISPVIIPKLGNTPVSSNLGQAWATLVGGVFGDPLVHVRFRRLKQSLFFDLGEPVRLAAKVAHQVNAIFFSHAHIDHIGGLTWFLRSRLGPFGPCRIFGPAETIRRIESFLGAITWDRIDDRGPLFEVYEIYEGSLRHARLQAGKMRIDQPDIPIHDGIILTEESFSVKAAVCDHNVPSVAYALLFPREINIRREQLAAAKLAPGPWLGTLKWCIATDAPETEIELPGGSKAKAGELARDLTIVQPGKKLAYAADMADTGENRQKVVELARAAHTFFCETAFTWADKKKADASQHLTTLAAVQIAREAGVDRLVPFHFSKRYEHNYRKVYEEILAAAGDVQILQC